MADDQYESVDLRVFDPPRHFWAFWKRLTIAIAALLAGNGTLMIAHEDGNQPIGWLFVLIGLPLVLYLLRDGHREDALAKMQYVVAERVVRPVRQLGASVLVKPTRGTPGGEIIVEVPSTLRSLSTPEEIAAARRDLVARTKALCQLFGLVAENLGKYTDKQIVGVLEERRDADLELVETLAAQHIDTWEGERDPRVTRLFGRDAVKGEHDGTEQD